MPEKPNELSAARTPNDVAMTDAIDPTTATSPALNRRAFAALGAGAVAALGSVETAFGQSEAFGKPHPAVVPEDDATIVVVHETLHHDDRTLDAYAALPKGDARGAIVVVQHIWGVDAQIRDTVRRFAKVGYATIAPDLYAGLGAPSGDDATDFAAFRPVAQKLSDATVDKDLLAAAIWGRTPPQTLRGGRTLKVGITGFCMGGAIALRQTSVNAAALASAAIFYGNPKNVPPLDVKIPLLGSYGGRDASIPAADVRAWERQLRVPHDIKIYDEAGHAFFDDTRSSYLATAATDAWSRTLAWFAKYLAS